MGLLREKRGKVPQLPNDTRWNSQLDCITTYTDNWQIYMDICREYRSEIDGDICRIIENRAVYNNACDLKVT